MWSCSAAKLGKAREWDIARRAICGAMRFGLRPVLSEGEVGRQRCPREQMRWCWAKTDVLYSRRVQGAIGGVVVGEIDPRWWAAVATRLDMRLLERQCVRETGKKRGVCVWTKERKRELMRPKRKKMQSKNSPKKRCMCCCAREKEKK